MDSGLGRTPSGLVQNPIWASPNPSCKGFEFRGEHGEGFDFFGAGGTRRRRVRFFLRVDSGFREKGSSICEKAMKGSSFFAGSELSPAQKSKKNPGLKLSFLCILLR